MFKSMRGGYAHGRCSVCGLSTVLCLSFVISRCCGLPTTVIDSPPAVAPPSIGADTQLNLFAGGTIGDDFDAFGGSEVNVIGGSVGDRFTGFSNSTVNVSGGVVGTSFSSVGVVNVSGGLFSCCFNALDGSLVTVSGGSFTNALHAKGGSEVNISGGSIGRDFRAFGGSTVNISGGSLGDNSSTSFFSNVKISGGDYRLDGVPINGLNTVGDTLPFNLPDGSVLSGTLADGKPFAFSSVDGDTIRNGTLTIELSSLPPIGPATIVLSNDPVPIGLRNGQTLVIDSRRARVGNDFNADHGSTVVMNSGQVGDNFEVVGAQITISGGAIGHSFDALSSSTVNISGGSVGDGFQAFAGSEVHISGGSIGDFFRASDGSKVNISSGVVGDGVRAFGGSEVNISGGRVGQGFTAYGGTTVNISGGSVGINFQSISGSEVNISGGSVGDGFRAPDGSAINLFGRQFVLDGNDITGLLTKSVPFTVNNRDATLTGQLVDGTPFSFVLNSQFTPGDDFFTPGAMLTVTLVPEPAGVLLLLIPMLTRVRLRRRSAPPHPRRPLTL